MIPATARQGYAVRIPLERSADFIDLQETIFVYKDSVFFDPSKMVASPQRYTSSYGVDLPADKYDKLYYTVRSGDNVGYIADWYDVRASDLRYWNNISRNLIRTGQKLVVYKPKGKSAGYREVNNMSFAQKQQFAGREVSAATTGSASGSDSGDDPVTGSTGSSSGAEPGGSSSGEYVTYTVQSGDTLWEIARKYPGVSETDLARLNNITDSSKIQPGQVIKIKRKG